MLTAIEETSEVLECPPVCLPPWLENPYRLVSLWHMLGFSAGSFISTSCSIIKYWQALGQGATITDQGIRELGSALGELQRESAKHGLKSTVSQLQRIRAYFDDANVTNPGLSQLLGELVVRLEEELHNEQFLALPPTRVPYYEPKDPLFGKQVDTNFASTAYDITEAGKCYALYRSTACVFHLMRVLEVGLRVFADRFAVPSDRKNWQNIIEGIEKEVRNMASDPKRPADWKDQQEFFSGAATHFMFIKDAWRNYVSHARGKSTEEEAEKIFSNVRGFMQVLATRLHE